MVLPKLSVLFRPLLVSLLASVPLMAPAQTFRGFSVSVSAVPVENPAEPLDRMMIKVTSRWGLSSDRQGTSIAAKLAQLSAASGTTLTLVRVMSGGEWLVELGQPLARAPMEQLGATLMAADASIEFAVPDRIFQSAGVPNDPRYADQWHYHPATSSAGGANLPSAWDMTTGAGVTVAVLDSGYRPHIDLAANILPGGFDFLSNDAIDYDDHPGRDNDPLDPFAVGSGGGGSICPPPCIRPHVHTPWHGTHVAGTIAALGNNNIGVTGVAYGAKVLPVRVFGPSGGYESDIVDAILWSAGLRVAPAYGLPEFPQIPSPRAQIINMSLGSRDHGACSVPMMNAINAAIARGVTVVASAGNNQGDSNLYAPGNCPNLISVAALDRNGKRASYSNHGSNITLAAPGGFGTNGVGAVLSTYNTGGGYPGFDSYASVSGTSMAAAHVSGVAALIKALRPNFTPEQIKTALKNSARQFVSGSGACTNATCGAGALDAGTAVAMLGGPSGIPLRPGLSGTWYNPATPGQGFLVDISTQQSYVYLGWYTYDKNGGTGSNLQTQQRWYSIQGSLLPGDTVKTMPIYLNTGGRFDNAPPTTAVVIGSATLSFQSCSVATLQFQFNPDGQPANQASGTIPLTRLTSDEYCATSAMPSFSLTASGIHPGLNGAWYNQATAGQGFQFNFAPRSNNYVYLGWYTYALDGTPSSGVSGQRWYSVQGNYTPGSRTVTNLGIWESTGGRLNAEQPPATHTQVGTADLHFTSCTSAHLTYRIAGRPHRTIQLSRLVGVYGCTN